MTGRGRGRPILGQRPKGQNEGEERLPHGLANGNQSHFTDFPPDVTKPPPEFTSPTSESNLSINAAEFVPRSFDQPQQFTIATEDSEDVNIDPLDDLRQAIFLLSDDPASFDEVVANLGYSLQGSIHDENTVHTLIEELFKQCVHEANFRYIGARLCNYLSHNLTQAFDSGNFRQLLLKRCHQEYKEREEVIATSPTRVIGFTYFMAELLVNLTVGNNEQSPILAVAVNDLLVTLFAHPNESTLKCVAQVLKLCGSILCKFEQKDDFKQTPKLDSVIRKVKHSVLDDSLPRSTRSMLLSVIELRANNWGQQDLSSNVDTSSQNTQQVFSNAPTFYNSSGHVISAAEAGYSQQDERDLTETDAYYNQYEASGDTQLWAQGPPDDGYYGDNVYENEDEYDDEMAAAYEEFLLNQQNQNGSRWSSAHS